MRVYNTLKKKGGAYPIFHVKFDSEVKYYTLCIIRACDYDDKLCVNQRRW